MSVEWFSKLKEINSLTKMKEGLLKRKADEENRVSVLEKRRLETIEQSNRTKQQIVLVHDQMAELEKSLKNFTEQKQRILDIGGDEKKIAHYSSEIDKFEEIGLEHLMKIEELETELKEAKIFISGIEKTIDEIQRETASEIEKIHHEVENINIRVNLLKDELPSDFKSLLVKITNKNLAHGPFTRIEQGSCFFCRFKISRIEESEIDMFKGLKNCAQCERIFLPFGA